MKYIHQVLYFSLLAVTTFATSGSTRDYEKIVAEREDVLEAIINVLEASQRTGGASVDNVLSAEVDLWTFRRDKATSREERIRCQGEIVRLQRSISDIFADRIGTATLVNLRLKEQLLAAEQRLWELQQTASGK